MYDDRLAAAKRRRKLAKLREERARKRALYVPAEVLQLRAERIRFVRETRARLRAERARRLRGVFPE